jgi:hypothetical protein
MSIIREFINNHIESIIIALIIALLVGVFFLWAGSGEETEYPVIQSLSEAAQGPSVVLTDRAKTQVTNDMYIAFNEDGSGCVLGGKNLEQSGIYVSSITHEYRDPKLYSKEFWEEMEKNGRTTYMVVTIDCK